jgi:hypothetical protein
MKKAVAKVYLKSPARKPAAKAAAPLVAVKKAAQRPTHVSRTEIRSAVRAVVLES